MQGKHFSHSFGAARVFCLGDVMLDHFHYGEVSRISPEAPVPVLRLSHKETMLGGAANTAANIASLGAMVDLVAPVGNDVAGIELRALLEANGRIAFVGAMDARGTIVKSRYSAIGQQLLRIDHEDLAPLAGDVVDDLVAAIPSRAGAADVMVLSDYAKGALPPTVCQTAIQAARSRGAMVVVDPKGHDFTKYRGATVLTPNEKELAVVLGAAPADLDDLVVRASALAGELNAAFIAITRGKAGVTLVTPKGLVAHIPSYAREVFDVSGAGDSFVAGLVCALSVGQCMVEAVRYANAVAGVAVSKRGTAIVWPREVLKLLAERDAPDHANVIRDYADAGERVANWREAGLSVGLTNGVFDLLHRGHLRTLRTARKACDRLIVAVNSDASVRRLKGEDRPVQDEMLRAEVLAAMEFVDLVVIFDEDTPLDLIKASAPDFIIKGGDYREEQVVGYDFVRARGGRVIIVPTLSGHSTTGTIAKLSAVGG